MPEHTFPTPEQQAAFDAEMQRRTAEAKAKGAGFATIQDYHYSEFLSRIQTRDEFHAEMVGKINAVLDSGYPLPIARNQINEIVSILSLNTIGNPQFWPVV